MTKQFLVVVYDVAVHSAITSAQRYRSKSAVGSSSSSTRLGFKLKQYIRGERVKSCRLIIRVIFVAPLLEAASCSSKGKRYIMQVREGDSNVLVLEIRSHAHFSSTPVPPINPTLA